MNKSKFWLNTGLQEPERWICPKCGSKNVESKEADDVTWETEMCKNCGEIWDVYVS